MKDGWIRREQKINIEHASYVLKGQVHKMENFIYCTVTYFVKEMNARNKIKSPLNIKLSVLPLLSYIFSSIWKPL